MELEKLIKLSDDELKQQELTSAEQIFRLRFQKSLGNNEGLKKLKDAEAGHRPHQDHRAAA